MKERNNSCFVRVIFRKKPRDIVSRNASALMRNKACGLFCLPLRSHITDVMKKKTWHYVFIHYSAYIMRIYFICQDKSRRRLRSVLTMDRFTDPIVFEAYALSSQRSFEMRNICSRREKVREREREKTGKWEEKSNLKSFLLEREHSHDVKAKEGMRYIWVRRLLNVNVPETIPRTKINQLCHVLDLRERVKLFKQYQLK